MSRSLRVLLLSYYCPPVGGPGAQRVEMLLQHLPPEVEVTVITAAVRDYQAFSPLAMPLDASRYIPAGDVHRLPTARPFRLFRLLSCCRLYGAVRWCYVPDVARKWARRACTLAQQLHQHQPFDVLLSVAPPFSAAVAGRDCARRLRIPWVCDLQDLWTGYLLGAWPTRWHYRREAALERSVLAQASTTVMLTPGSRDWILRAHSFLDPERVECVTNGYCAADFAGPSTLAGPKFVIVHTGVFCGPPAPDSRLRRLAHGRSFQVRHADRRTHSPETLVHAMELLADPRVEFRHLGPMDSENQRLFESSAVRDQIRVFGYRDHREAVAELRVADAAFLCLATCLDHPRNELVPQKTLEYLGARKPVLAPIQDGDAKDFLLEAGSGLCTPPRDAPALAAALRSLVEAKFAGRPLAHPREDFIRLFEWSRLAGRLVAILDRAACGRPACV